jgi:hypothetical protein
MPAHQHRTTTGSVPQLRGPKIRHSTFQTVAPPCQRTHVIIIFAVATPTESRTEGRREIRDRPSDGPMLGPGLRPRNCPTDTTTDRTTDTRKVGHKLGQQLGPSDGRTVLPSEQGITDYKLILYKLHCVYGLSACICCNCVCNT